MTSTSDRIALVMGLGRSGTTFLAKLIDTAPEVVYRHEPDVVLSTDLPHFCHRNDLEPHLSKARDFLYEMSRCRHWRATGTLPLFSKSYRSPQANLAYRMMVLSSKTARRLRLPVSDSVPDMIRDDRARLHLIKSVSALGRARLFGDALPDLSSVHIIRHPCAVYASLRSGMDQGVMRARIQIKPLFDHPEAEAYPFRRDDIVNASFEEQIAYRWMLSNDKAAADMAGLSTYLQIRYEDLCTDVDRVSRQVFGHLGLPLGAQTGRFIDDISNAPSGDGSRVGYFKVKRPITSAVDKWKTQLDSETVERIRKVVSHSPLGRAYFEDA